MGLTPQQAARLLELAEVDAERPQAAKVYTIRFEYRGRSGIIYALGETEEEAIALARGHAHRERQVPEGCGIFRVVGD